MDREQIRQHVERIVDRYANSFDPIFVGLDEPAETQLDFAVLAARGWNFPPELMAFMEVMKSFDTPGLLDVGPDVLHDIGLIAETYDHEMSWGQWDADLVPFLAIGNGDFWCLSASAGPQSPVIYACHEDAFEEEGAPTFAHWLMNIETFLGADPA